MENNKIILYSRVSTDQQTLAQQERTAYEWLNAHNMEVTDVVSDEGVSGGVSYKERKLGKVLLPMLKSGDTVIVSEISRLSRSMFDLSKLIHEEFKPRGVRLVIVSMGIDLRCDKMTAIDELILNNFSFAAQLEKQLISERTKSALEVKKKQGIKFGAASANYRRNTEAQKLGRIKMACTKMQATLASQENQILIGLLKDYLDLPDDYELWRIKDVRTSSALALSIIADLRKIKMANTELFKGLNLNGTDAKNIQRVRNKIFVLMRAIDTLRGYKEKFNIN